MALEVKHAHIISDNQNRLAGKYDLTESWLAANIQRRAFKNFCGAGLAIGGKSLGSHPIEAAR
jgi:hypothetical protein